MTNKEKIEAILGEQGFSDYRWIHPREIVVAQWVRVKCAFGCGNYGLGACPPNTPSVDECERFFKEYESGLIIRLNKFADRDSYPSDWSMEMTDKLLDIEREIFLSGFKKYFYSTRHVVLSAKIAREAEWIVKIKRDHGPALKVLQ